MLLQHLLNKATVDIRLCPSLLVTNQGGEYTHPIRRSTAEVNNAYVILMAVSNPCYPW